MSIFEFQQKLAQRLMVWSGLSIVASLPLLLDTWKPFRDTGGQFLSWGIIDAVIAYFSQRGTEKKRLAGVDTVAEARTLRRFLKGSILLDVFMVAGGVHLLKRDGGKWHGHGIGVIVQAGFLFLFDLFHLRRIPRE